MKYHWVLQAIPISVIGVGMVVTGYTSWFLTGLMILAIAVGLCIVGGKIHEKRRRSS